MLAKKKSEINRTNKSYGSPVRKKGSIKSQIIFVGKLKFKKTNNEVFLQITKSTSLKNIKEYLVLNNLICLSSFKLSSRNEIEVVGSKANIMLFSSTILHQINNNKELKLKKTSLTEFGTIADFSGMRILIPNNIVFQNKFDFLYDKVNSKPFQLKTGNGIKLQSKSSISPTTDTLLSFAVKFIENQKSSDIEITQALNKNFNKLFS